MATHSSILAWKIPWTEEPGRLQLGSQKSWTRLSATHTHICELLTLLRGKQNAVAALENCYRLNTLSAPKDRRLNVRPRSAPSS